MIKNHLKIGLRIFLKYKVFSFINVFGLAAAMSICMLVMLMWVDQKSYDDFHVNKERVYRLVTSPIENNHMRATIPFPTMEALKSNYSAIEDVALLRRGFGGDAIYTKGNDEKKYSELRGYFTGPSFFNVFDFKLAYGDKASALSKPNSLVISSSVKKQLFGEDDPIGKTIRFSDRGLNYWTDESTAPVDWGLYSITGVFADQPKSHLKFDVMASAATLDLLYKESKIEDLRNNWGTDHQAYGYAMMKSRANEEDLESALASLTKNYLENNTNESLKKSRFNFQPLTKITPGEATGNTTDSSLPLFAYYILGGLALIIMLASCLNYTSLSVARAVTRSNEIGVRKVNGASMNNLIYQFISEAFITVFLALVLANILLLFLRKVFLGLWLNQYLNFTLDLNLKVYGFFLVFALLVGFVAGVYPAIRMSRFNSIKALKGHEASGAGKMGLRKFLTITQFTLSLIFIISSILVYKQLNKFKEFDYGFNAKNVLNINLQSNDYELIKDAFQKIPDVENVSACAYVPADGRNDNTNIAKVDSEINKTAIDVSVDLNFTEVMDIEILAGQKIPVSADSISNTVMVNEMAAKELGYAQPSLIVGETLEVGGENKVVSGVFEDFNFFMVFTGRQTGPIVFQYKPSYFKYATVRIAEADQQETIAKLERVWQELDPVHPLQYEFYEQQLADNNQGIIDLVTIIGFLAVTAILIACLGLFGMATYSTERRTKEIGVRRVLGANIFTLNYLLSIDFLKLVGIAILVAVPASYYLNRFWLERMITRVEFGLGTIALGVFIVTALALLSVIPQSFRIANKNPVDTLKVE